MAPLYVCLVALIALFSCTHQLCVPEPIMDEDAMFCCKDVQVIYPEIGDVGCQHIPACNGYIQKLVKTWGMPEIKYCKAKPGALYTVIFVDPDAPSRSNPARKCWRHLMIVDVPGEDLINGNVASGRILSEYYAPSPPKGTGCHRYQISVYVQHPGTQLDLEDKKSFGSWDPNAFAEHYQLEGPVATTQFKAQNPEDEANFKMCL